MLEKFVTIDEIAVPLELQDVDTDRIIPARFLRKPRTVGYGQFMFYDLRFDDDGQPRSEFPLNRDVYRGARILVADVNFGCGSSREGAVWALSDTTHPDSSAGFRCIIAPSFGDIFYNNCTNNGVLPVRLGPADCATLRRQLEEAPGARLQVDLPKQVVRGPDGRQFSFDIDPFRKQRLLEGQDEISLTMTHQAAIEAFESRRRSVVPWLTPDAEASS